MTANLGEKQENLWLLVAAPVIWGAHFLLAYCTAAVWCAKLPDSPGGMRITIAVYTVAALAGIAITGWSGWRMHRFGESERPHDFDSREDRHRFLGFARLLLSGLSAIAVIYATLPAVFLGSCHQ
jgi:hypothetical protein